MCLQIAECFLNKLGNAYYIPNIRAKNHFCRTNLHSATAFRGFGTPQAVFVTETIVAHLAEELNKKQHEVINGSSIFCKFNQFMGKLYLMTLPENVWCTYVIVMLYMSYYKWTVSGWLSG